MNLKKHIVISFIILMILNFQSLSNENVHIIYKVDNHIITNFDIEKEFNYLVTLNSELKNLDKKKAMEIARESALREKIKEIELSKYFDIKSIDMNIEIYLKDFYKTLNIKNENEFNEYLIDNDLKIDYITKKIQLEILWNQLIFDRYKDQINIDKIKLKEKIKKTNKKIEKKMYSLSEIVFEKENNENLDKKIKKINQSINEIGFNNTANVYSISDSSKFGGKIGWIEESQLSEKIIQSLNLLKVGQYTMPMQSGAVFLVIKIEEIKYEKQLIDEKIELDKLVKFETNRQLEQYSKIFYKQIKINNSIDEL